MKRSVPMSLSKLFDLDFDTPRLAVSFSQFTAPHRQRAALAVFYTIDSIKLALGDVGICFCSKEAIKHWAGLRALLLDCGLKQRLNEIHTVLPLLLRNNRSNKLAEPTINALPRLLQAFNSTLL